MTLSVSCEGGGREAESVGFVADYNERGYT